ncbi:transglutaminase-like domain-containing protein [Wansuia hejianensis]|uniref:Transglutaminase domain-containing protein n=1 Tax=Wansuia hejianensis TaxID=2763667 RepID=A0A926IN18_9FIRM|nr:transglutaminase-like domain-containing protein [Wansuia hejianensis]MBC8591196.1 transglutaminase domain-containing protein [Wansuia hejianensis]
MLRLSKKSHNRIINIIYFLLVFNLVYMIGLVINLKMKFPKKGLLVLFVSQAVKFLLLNPLFFFIILTTAIVISLLINHFSNPFIIPFLDRLYFLMDNIMNNIKGKEAIESNNVLVLWSMVIAIVSLYTAIILFKNKNIYLLLPGFMIPLIFYWYTFYDEAYISIALFLFLFFILMALDRYSKIINQIGKIQTSMNVKYKKPLNINFLYKSWLKTAIIYGFLIVSIGLLLPKTNKHIEWLWLQDKAYGIFPSMEYLRSNEFFDKEKGDAALFDFTHTGYQKDPYKLGGPIELSNRKIMTVQANDTSYLRGNIKHIYDGYSWHKANLFTVDYNLEEDFSEITEIDKRMYYKQMDISITHHSFASTTLFSSYKPTEVYYNNSDYLVTVGYDHELVFHQGVYDNESYLIKTYKPLPYGILMELGINMKKSDIDNIDIYLQVPNDKITNRTIELNNKIIEGSTNDFEKAIAIEKYLRNNYEYTLHPNIVPDGYDFIDYFLFEEKRGYCTYYATSMAIMLRLEGIPTRYVEGYLANNLIDENLYEVRQENAHAWVEAFIEPVGWMTFEPTPNYSIEPRYENYSSSNNTIPREDMDTDSNHTPMDIEDRPIDDKSNIKTDKLNNKDDSISKNTTKESSKNILLYIILIPVLIILIIFIKNFFKIRYRKSQIKKLPYNTRIIYLYNDIINIMERLGYHRPSGKTHWEYAYEFAYKFSDIGEKGIIEITDIFMKSKYGNYMPSDSDIDDFKIFKNDVDKRLKMYLGKRSYYYNKYIKGI